MHDDDNEVESIGGASRRPLRREEFPDEEDLEASLDETDPCPHCGAKIYVEGEWCPKCGQWLVKEKPGVLPAWAVLAAVLVLVGFLLMMLLGR